MGGITTFAYFCSPLLSAAEKGRQFSQRCSEAGDEICLSATFFQPAWQKLFQWKNPRGKSFRLRRLKTGKNYKIFFPKNSNLKKCGQLLHNRHLTIFGIQRRLKKKIMRQRDDCKMSGFAKSINHSITFHHFYDRIFGKKTLRSWRFWFGTKQSATQHVFLPVILL